MRIVTILLVVAAMAVSTKLAFQWRALREAKAEVISLRGENTPAQPQPDTTSEELERLRGETRDLLKLRNQISQLRSQVPQLAQAQAQNERLRQALQSAPAPVENPAAATPPGFTSREALVESGLATPEATLQSFFRAMRDGDVPRFMQSIAPEVRQD